MLFALLFAFLKQQDNGTFWCIHSHLVSFCTTMLSHFRSSLNKKATIVGGYCIVGHPKTCGAKSSPMTLCPI